MGVMRGADAVFPRCGAGFHFHTISCSLITFSYIECNFQWETWCKESKSVLKIIFDHQKWSNKQKGAFWSGFKFPAPAGAAGWGSEIYIWCVC